MKNSKQDRQAHVPIVQLHPTQKEWQELKIIATEDRRSMPSEALAIIHIVFSQRYPKGLDDFNQKNPGFFDEEK
ncbi:MAG: hypothetical protein KKC20_24950 [Proteobacteria bacterium]|jgi:hypothetical protein|nr:hypothetical protein [Pseudomonadota bacterium]